MSDGPQRSVLGSMLFNIYINDIDSGIECTLSKFVNDCKLFGVVDISKGWNAIQRDLGRLEQWAEENLIMFNKSKRKVFYLGCGNSHYQYKLGDEMIEYSLAKKGSGGTDG